MRLTMKLSTDYSIQINEEESLCIMARKKWLALEPWRPFFWYGQLPTGICLRSERRPVLFPSGHKVDEEIYFAIRLRPHVEGAVLSLHRYAFQTDPARHTKRSVHRKGYWHFDASAATSPSESIKLLKDLMCSLETLSLNRDAIHSSLDITLNRLVAWEERMASAIHPLSRWPDLIGQQKVSMLLR